MYHISDLKKFMRCERNYFLSINENSVFKPYLRSDESINDLLIQYLCDDKKCFIGVKNDKNDRFISEKNDYEWFCHPRFEDNDLRINIPFLHKVNARYDIYDMYFIYYGCNLKELDTLTYSISVNVFRKLGYEVNNIHLIYLNSDYLSDGNIDAKKLFLTTTKFKSKDILGIVDKNNIDYNLILRRMNTTSLQDYPSKKCKYCHQNGLCEYYDFCFKNEEKIDDNSILTLVSSQNKNVMNEEGIHRLKDVDLDRLEGNRVQYAQIMADRNDGLFIDRLALKDFLNRISVRPISFIDFEWDSFLIPPYKNMKPLGCLCFEFALYYIDEDGHMEHRTFVGTGDCRKEFIEGLRMYLPDKGPILAYNAEGAEKIRLQELADVFEEDKDYLEDVKDRFVDLAAPFIEGIVYDVRMQGNYTLKRLVDMCSDYSYGNLDIYDGMEAVYNWRDVDKGSENQQKIVDNLKEYCSLDAYGLFLVYKWLIEIMVESK